MSGPDGGDVPTVPRRIWPRRRGPAEASFDPPLLHGRIGRGHPDIHGHLRRRPQKVRVCYRQICRFFKVRKNVIFERVRFNRHSQQDGETAEEFITSLYQLVDSCDYGVMQDQMLRDRIVVGIQDQALSQRMQMDPELTLEKAKTFTRQKEAIREQQLMLESTTKTTTSVDQVQRLHQKGKRTQSHSFKPPPARPPSSKLCMRCRRGPHPRHQCPAKDVQCHKCKHKGHFAVQCRSKSVAEVGDIPLSEQEYDDIAYLNTLGSQDANYWTCGIQVNGQYVNFKVDTGAKVTVISEDASRALGLDTLQPSTKKLHGLDHSPLEVVGQATVRLAYRDKQCTHVIFVLRKVKHNLLGLPAIQALNVLTQVDTVSRSVSEQTSIPDQYPSLFKGLGTFKGDSYAIQLKPDAKPFTLYTPRNVPIPLRKKVKEELPRMQSLGVISPVEEPTQWCAGMVVVPKLSGAVRICVDYRQLNESVLREVHPLPKVDATLAQLAGATIFSKVDANCGFWQIPLSEASQPS